MRGGTEDRERPRGTTDLGERLNSSHLESLRHGYPAKGSRLSSHIPPPSLRVPSIGRLRLLIFCRLIIPLTRACYILKDLLYVSSFVFQENTDSCIG